MILFCMNLHKNSSDFAAVYSDKAQRSVSAYSDSNVSSWFRHRRRRRRGRHLLILDTLRWYKKMDQNLKVDQTKWLWSKANTINSTYHRRRCSIIITQIIFNWHICIWLPAFHKSDENRLLLEWSHVLSKVNFLLL